jgi:hypothetical protein
MGIRDKIRAILNEQPPEPEKRRWRKLHPRDVMSKGSDIPATDPVPGGVISSAVAFNIPQRKATQQEIFQTLMGRDHYKEILPKVYDVLRNHRGQKVSEIIETLRKIVTSTKMAKDKAEDLVDGINELIEERRKMAEDNLQQANELIKRYNETIHDVKKNMQMTTAETYFSLPELRDMHDFQGLLAYIANGPNIVRRFAPLLGIDLQSLEAEAPPEAHDALRGKLMLLQMKVDKSRLEPNQKKNFIRRINTAKQRLATVRIDDRKSYDKLIRDIKKLRQDFNNAKSGLTEAETRKGFNAPNWENAEKRLDEFFGKMFSKNHIQGVKRVYPILYELFQTLAQYETNLAVLEGLQKKVNKIKQFKGRGGAREKQAALAPTPTLPPVEVDLPPSEHPMAQEEMEDDDLDWVVLDPADFPVDPEEPVDSLDDLEKEGYMEEENTPPIEPPPNIPEMSTPEGMASQTIPPISQTVKTPPAPPTSSEKFAMGESRQRKISKETYLKEAWKRNSKNIIGKKVKEDDEQNPNVHLGGL